jgi:hypothetical protein
MKIEKNRAEKENERSKRDWERVNREIRQLTIAQQSASRAERRVGELEAKKKRSSAKFWKIAGNVLGLGIPALFGMGI